MNKWRNLIKIYLYSIHNNELEEIECTIENPADKYPHSKSSTMYATNVDTGKKYIVSTSEKSVYNRFVWLRNPDPRLAAMIFYKALYEQKRDLEDKLDKVRDLLDEMESHYIDIK